MCLSPSFIWSSIQGLAFKQPIRCGLCRLCETNRVNEWVGRGLAEAALCDWVWTLTLTYAPGPNGQDREDGAERIIVKEHFQKAIRSIRKRGHQCKYLVAGERGDRKGRVHFHVVLWGYGPELDLGSGRGPLKDCERNWPEWWPHGHVYAERGGSEKSIRYVCKYLFKGARKPHEETWISMSKKPMIGMGWFISLAERHVQRGTLPQSREYRPPGSNKHSPFLMPDSVWRKFVAHIRDRMRDEGLMKPDRLSEWMRDQFDMVDALDEENDPKAVDVEVAILAHDLDKKQRDASRESHRRGWNFTLDQMEASGNYRDIMFIIDEVIQWQDDEEIESPGLEWGHPKARRDLRRLRRAAEEQGTIHPDNRPSLQAYFAARQAAWKRLFPDAPPLTHHEAAGRFRARLSKEDRAAWSMLTRLLDHDSATTKSPPGGASVVR